MISLLLFLLGPAHSLVSDPCAGFGHGVTCAGATLYDVVRTSSAETCADACADAVDCTASTVFATIYQCVLFSSDCAELAECEDCFTQKKDCPVVQADGEGDEECT